MSDIPGDFFLQRLLPPGVHLFDESQRCWITEHPRKFLLLQFQQQADIALANATAFASAYRISLWSKRWERLSVDVGMQHGASAGDQEPQVFLFDLDWAEVWLQRATVGEVDDALDVVVLRLELMDASNIAVVQVVHLPICLRDEKSAEGCRALEGLEMLTHKAIALSRPNEPATTDVVFQDLRTTGHNLTVQRRMFVSATNLALLGRPVTTPGTHTKWTLITTPMLSPLEFATPLNDLPCEVMPRTFASVLSLNIDAPELLENGHELLVKVYASCQGFGSKHQGPTSLLGKFMQNSFAGAWNDMSELTLPPFSDLEQGGVEVAVRCVVEEAKKGHATKETCLAQSIFSLDIKHLCMIPDTISDSGKPQYCLPTGTYDLPLICIDPATQCSVIAGMIELRLISFAASPECSWWASEGLIHLTRTEPSDATFAAFLSAVQRCNPQQADAMFGAATPVDMVLCFPKLIRHLLPLSESPVDSVEFHVGCQTLSMLLGYLTDDAMAHPKLVGRVKAALFEALHLSTIVHIIAHLSTSVFPATEHSTFPINWQQARGLCWLMSQTLVGEEDDSDSDLLTAFAEDALEALCERLRLTWQEVGTPAPEADGIAAVVCLSMLLPAILDVLPTGFVVQLVLSCLPPGNATTVTAAPAITALHCARLSLMAQLAGAMDSKRISALCNEETTPENSKSSTNLAFQLSKVAAAAIATTLEDTCSTILGGDSHSLSCGDLTASVEWLVHEYLRYMSEFKQEIQLKMPDLRPTTEPPLLTRPVPITPIAARPTPNPEPLPPPPPDLPRRRQRSMLHLAAITTLPSASMATSTNPIQRTQLPPHRYWARFVAAADLYVQGGLLALLGSCLQVWRSTGQDVILKTQAGHVVTAFVRAVTDDLQQLCAAAGATTLVELFGQLKHIIRGEAVEPATMQKSHSVSLLFSCLCDVLTNQPHCQPNAAVGEHTLLEDCLILLLGSEAVANLLALDASNNRTITTSVDRLPLTLIVASCKLVLPLAETVQISRPEEVATLLKCLALLAAQLREHAPYLQSALAEDFSLRFDAVMLTHWVLAVVHASDSSLRSRVSTPISAALLLALKVPLLYVFDIVSASDEQDDDLDDGNAASTLEAYLQAMIQSLTVPARAGAEKLLEDGSLEPHMTPRRRGSSNCSDFRLAHPVHQTGGDMCVAGVPIPAATKITIGTFKQYVALYQSLLHDDDDDGTQPTRMLDLACDGHDVLIACKWTKTMNICAPAAARTHDKLLDIYTQIRNIFIVTERDVTNLLQYMSCRDGSKQEVGAVLCRAALLECRVTMLQTRFSMVPSITSSPSAGRLSDNLSTNILDQLQQCVTAWQEAFSALPDLYHEIPYRVWQLKLEVANFQKRSGQLSPARRVEEFERFHEMLRRLLAAMVAGGKWESVRELVALVRPQYESKTAVMPRIRVLLQELKRFQEGVIDHLGRHGECRCIPLYFAVFVSRWPWDAENAGVDNNSAMGDDAGVWLLIKSDPVHALGRRRSKALQKLTLPSQSGYHAVLQQLREWFPEYRVMPPGAVRAQHGGRQQPYLQLYPAVPRVAQNINNLKQRRARITHTVEATVPSKLRVLRTASADSTLGRTNSKNPYDALGFGTTRQLSVDTALELHDVAGIDAALNSNADASWHQIDLASAFTVYIEHQRAHTDEHADDAKTPNEYFGVLAVELTAQTACHGQNLESWGSPMILADASKATGTSALNASVFVHNYGVHCLEWLSGALETIANEKGVSDKDTGVCSLQAIRDSLIAHLEVSLHFPTLSPLGVHSTPSLAAEIEDKLDTMWREQRRAMRKALIRTSSLSGAEMAGASDMDAVKLQVEGDLPERIAQAREAFSLHKQAMLRALSLLRGPKGPHAPLTPPSLSVTLKAPGKKSAVDKQKSDRNEEVCLWLESLFATLLDDCDEASSFS